MWEPERQAGAVAVCAPVTVCEGREGRRKRKWPDLLSVGLCKRKEEHGGKQSSVGRKGRGDTIRYDRFVLRMSTGRSRYVYDVSEDARPWLGTAAAVAAAVCDWAAAAAGNPLVCVRR